MKLKQSIAVFSLISVILLLAVTIYAGVQIKENQKNALIAVDDSNSKSKIKTATIDQTNGESQNNPPTDCEDELDTRCWKTYRNEELGFEVKYPLGWKITNDGVLYKWHEGIEQEFQNQSYFNKIYRLAKLYILISFEVNSKKLSLEQVWASHIDDEEIKDYLTIANQIAIRSKCGGIEYGECLSFIYKDKIFNIYVPIMLFPSSFSESFEIKRLNNELLKIISSIQLIY